MSSLVEVGQYDKPIKAELARLYLGSHGVHAVIFGALSFEYEGGPLRLMVLNEHLEAAQRVLRSYKP